MFNAFNRSNYNKTTRLGISTQLYLGHKLDYSNHQSAFVTSSWLL